MVKKISVLLLFSLLTACSSTSKMPRQYSIKGDGAQVLNRDINGKSLSVVIRIYQLRDASDFSKLTFDTLAAGYPETELLETSLLTKTDVILVPGGTYASSERLLDETRFIGIVGMFRNPDPHHWRQLVETVDAKGNRIAGLTLRAQDCHIAIHGPRLLLPGQPPQPKGDCGMGNVSSVAPSRPPLARSAPHEHHAPRTGNAQAQPSSRFPSMPEVNVNIPNTIAPANVRVGGPGGTTVTVGETVPSQYPGGGSAPPAYYSPPGTYVPAR